MEDNNKPVTGGNVSTGESQTDPTADLLIGSVVGGSAVLAIGITVLFYLLTH